MLSLGDENDLNNFVETSHPNSPEIVDVLNAAMAENSAFYAAITAPCVSVEDNTPFCSATCRDHVYLSNFEHTNFHPENSTPD